MIKIVAVGRIKEKSMVSLIQEYTKRMTTVHKLEIIELDNSKHKDSEVDKIIEDESQRLLSKVGDKDDLILLDLKGKNISSPDLSKLMDKSLSNGRNIVFMIGGSHGVSDQVRREAKFIWQMSALTFPHQLVRLLLVEQIYRGFMIQKNHPYHK